MKKKILGIFVCMLLIATAVLPASGIMTISTTKKVECSLSSDVAEESSVEIVSKIEEQGDTTPRPAATKTGYLSIPAAAFTPRNNNTYVENYGYRLSGEVFFVAPVNLPHRATVTNLTYYWINEAPASARLHLSRSYMNGSIDEMANAWISGSGNGSSWDDTIDYADIDNSLYSYYLEFFIGPDMGCYGVIIEYTYTSGVSLVSMDEGEENQVSNVAVR